MTRTWRKQLAPPRWNDWSPVAAARATTPEVCPRNGFSRQIDGAQFAQTRLGLRLDEQQIGILSGEHYRLILNCTRQWGKSTITAAKAVHRAWTRPGSLTLIVSPSERQSREFLRKAKTFVEQLRIPPRGDGDNPVSLLFPNKSRIVGVPGKEARIRGFSAVSLLILDEASWVSDEQYEAVQPMLATTDGDVWMLSTPWGARGFFWREWTRGGPDWYRVSVKATECPRIHPHFLEKQKKDMGEAVFRREYLCEFMDTGNSVFRRKTSNAQSVGKSDASGPSIRRTFERKHALHNAL